jgi:hypothetical protein
MLPMPGVMIDTGQYGQKSQNTNSCDMDLSCPVTFLRMPASEVIMYSTSKKRVLLAIISSKVCRSIILEKEFLIGKIKQNFGM